VIAGKIQVANPRRLSGWVRSALHPNIPVRLQIVNNGLKIGLAVADRYSPELEKAGIGNGHHAFSFEFPPGLISSEVHVIRILQESDGAELPGSPITLRASQSFELADQALVGSIDLVSLTQISGWARDELRPDIAVSLSIFDNDQFVGRALANGYREDLKGAGIGTGRHAFELLTSLEPSKIHVIRVRRELDGVEIPGSPVTLSPSRPDESVELLAGSIDAVSCLRVSGWARDSLQPDVPLSLLICNNDRLIGRLMANAYRQDLKEARIGNGRFAFDFEFPTPLVPFETNVIRVMRETDGAELPGSPVTLRASQSFDSEVERLLAEAISRCGSAEDIPRKIDFLAEQIDLLLQQNADAESLRADRDRYRRLMQRWKSQPLQESSPIVVSVSPMAVLRALIIDDRLPKSGRDAGSNAILSHIFSLQRMGYQVTFAPAIDLSPAAGERAAMESVGVKVCCSPYYGSVEEILRRQAGEFDLVYLHRVPNASKYGELVTSYFPQARKIYSVADLHHVRLLRQAAVEDRPELIPLSRRYRLAEFAAAAFSNAVITHSRAETELLKSAVPGASVFTVPWSVEPQATKTPFSTRRGFGFIGGFGHAPNQDAVRWLIKEIMPLVRSLDPSIQCYLVGSDMPEQFREITGDGIVPLGHMESLTEIFDRVRLTVAPLAYGAGLKGKVIDSLAAGIPCVCTSVAAEGFDLPAPLQACVSDDPASIAESIVRIHNDKAANDLCSRAGLEFVAAEFSKERLDALLSEVVGPSEKRPAGFPVDGVPSESIPSKVGTSPKASIVRPLGGRSKTTVT
jgi:O-antigen biosynthesis protein